MKRFRVITVTGILCLLIPFLLRAQERIPRPIPSYGVSIGYNQTSNLIFPYAIKSVDRGSADVLVQKAKGVNNVLQLKAARKGFPETNLTVITEDGRFYSFLVGYANEPEALNLSFAEGKRQIMLAGGPTDASTFSHTARLIKGQKAFLHVRHKEQKMEIRLASIYLKDDLMYFDLQLKNKSVVDYLPENLQFFIRDRKRQKRTAVQQVEVKPVYGNELTRVGGGKTGQLIFAFKSFTILPSQRIVIELQERGGGRTLQLKVGHRTLLKTRKLASTF